MVSSDNPEENLLATYEGTYIPTWIPNGYEVVSVNNKESSKTIKYQNSSDNVISFTEHTQNNDKKFNLDKEDFDSYEVYQNNHRETIVAIKGDIINLFIIESDTIVHIAFNDETIDILSFAEMIEKK